MTFPLFSNAILDKYLNSISMDCEHLEIAQSNNSYKL